MFTFLIIMTVLGAGGVYYWNRKTEREAAEEFFKREKENARLRAEWDKIIDNPKMPDVPRSYVPPVATKPAPVTPKPVPVPPKPVAKKVEKSSSDDSFSSAVVGAVVGSMLSSSDSSSSSNWSSSSSDSSSSYSSGGGDSGGGGSSSDF